MKRRKLEGWLRRHGAQFVRHGRSHDVWTGPSGRPVTVPRHSEINVLTGCGICDDLGVPRPPGR